MSKAAKVVREHGLTFDQVVAMDATAIDDTFFPGNLSNFVRFGGI